MLMTRNRLGDEMFSHKLTTRISTIKSQNSNLLDKERKQKVSNKNDRKKLISKKGRDYFDTKAQVKNDQTTLDNSQMSDYKIIKKKPSLNNKNTFFYNFSSGEDETHNQNSHSNAKNKDTNDVSLKGHLDSKFPLHQGLQCYSAHCSNKFSPHKYNYLT